MRKICFKNCKELADAVVKRYEDLVKEDDRFLDVEVIAYYNEAREILAQLIKYGYKINSIEIGDANCDGYCDEFSISILDGEVWCEKCKTEKGYLYGEARTVYLMDNCNSKIIPYIESSEIYEVSLSQMENSFYKDMWDCCDDGSIYKKSEKKSHITDSHIPEVGIDKDEDDDLHGFTIKQSDDYGYSSISFYSTDELTEESVKRIIDRFDL